MSGSGVSGAAARWARPWVWFFVCALVVGCGGGGGGSPDGGGDADGGAEDGGGLCTSDADCDDGTYCNGEETCDPDAATADALGCVAATEPPCLETQTCNEDASRCESECDVSPDADGDGHDALECGGDDCDDANPDRFPGNAEVCDADDVDEDCDPTTFGDTDADGDGAVDAACCNVTPAGEMTCGADCDDSAAGVNPDAAEICDGSDNDCDGEVDEGGELQTYYRDADGDGRGTTLMTLRDASCTPPDGYVDNSDDCDDTNPDTYVGATELCDGVDNDCGEVGSPGGAQPGEDDDGDEHARPDADCEGGFPKDDCNDADDAIYTGAPELCDRLDNDCSDSGGVDPTEDMDEDGFAPVDASCSGGPLPATDCDDSTPEVNPDISEICNGADDDCDGVIDGYPVSMDCSATALCIGGSCGAVRQVAAGGAHSCALSEALVASCWGANDRGQLGDGTTTDRTTPVPVSSLTSVEQIVAGDAHTCARQAQAVYCWGANDRGQLGDGTTTDRATPVEVPLTLGAEELVSEITAGATHTCARLTDMDADTTRVFCWGANDRGQLGRDHPTDQPSPVQVTVTGKTEDIAAGGGHTCAASRTGTVECWGANDYGELGITPDGDVLVPTEVSALAGLSLLALGGDHSCGAEPGETGLLYCWGRNHRGQLGDGSTDDSTAPRDVKLTEINDTSSGDAHSCALGSGGSPYCWGANDRGQVTTSSETSVTLAESPASVTIVRSIAAGGEHTCLATSDQVLCRGANDRGQLGDGTTDDRDTATAVPF